ncbi:MAG: glucokinase [Deltaproteobacteria bacterium]|nr:glucokinase [Deltaproteobacteria bacterium]
MRILAADIGGTNARFRLMECEPLEGETHVVEEAVLASADHARLEDAVRSFLAERPAPSRACFALAGPVVEGRCEATNLPWKVDESELSLALGIPRLRLVNDFYAVARGVEALGEGDLRMLRDGAAHESGPRLILGAGTGLGMAVLLPGRPPRVLVSEGGHTGFAPRDAIEDALLRYLRLRRSRVSVERVVSGPGLANIYDFMVDSKRAEGLESLRRLDLDRPARIAAAAVDDAGAAMALDLFSALYGAAAGDLALSILPTGGVFLAGGIAPKVIRGARGERFLHAFADKGRMKPLLAAMRVQVIEAGDVGLRGATLSCLDPT